MEKFTHIRWEPRYSVHVDMLDEQHQKLFEIVNRLMDIHDTVSDELYPVIVDLVDFVFNHFRDEQMVMMKFNYPGFASHCESHGNFIEKVQDFLKRYKENDEHLTVEMIVFLRDWIFTHTTLVDSNYGTYLYK